jgi:drug/metabolite transporter (DMT)-like permease
VSETKGKAWVPAAALTFTVVAWGLNFSMIKVAFDGMADAVPGTNEPGAAALVRWLIMMPLIYATCRLMGLDMKVDREDWPKLLMAGFMASGAYMALFVVGMRTAPAADGAIALATAPILMAILSIITKHDKFHWSLVFGSVIAFAGVGLVVSAGGNGGTGHSTGTLIVFASAFVWALSVIMMKPLLSKYQPIKVMALSLPGAGIALIPLGIVPALQTDWGAVTTSGWVGLAYLILIAGSAAFTTYYVGLSHLGPARTGLIQYLIPGVAFIGAWLIRGDTLGYEQFLGLGIVIIGVALGLRKPKAVAQT